MIEETNWMLEVWETDSDFLLEWETELPPLFKQNDIRYEYSQWKTLHCTLYSSFGALSDLKDYQLTDVDIQEIVDMSVQRGKPLNRWRNTQLGVKCVCDRWNSKFPDDKVVYFRIDVLSNNYAQVLKNGYTVVMSFKGNNEYSLDHYEDGVVDWVTFNPSTRWHATTSLYLNDNKVYIKDSYKGRKRKDWQDDNYYQLKDIVWLVNSWCYYPSAYVIMSEQSLNKNIEDLKRLNGLKLKINDVITKNSEIRHLTNSETYKAELEGMNNINREKLVDIQRELNKLW